MSPCSISFAPLISAGELEAMLVEVGSRFSAVSYVGVDRETFENHAAFLTPFGFAPNKSGDEFVTPWSEQLERLLSDELKIEASFYTRKPFDPAQQAQWQSVHYWYWEHWKFFRAEVKTSIVQGIAVFLSSSRPTPRCAASSVRRRNSMRANSVPVTLRGKFYLRLRN